MLVPETGPESPSNHHPLESRRVGFPKATARGMDFSFLFEQTQLWRAKGNLSVCRTGTQTEARERSWPCFLDLGWGWERGWWWRGRGEEILPSHCEMGNDTLSPNEAPRRPDMD